MSMWVTFEQRPGFTGEQISTSWLRQHSSAEARSTRQQQVQPLANRVWCIRWFYRPVNLTCFTCACFTHQAPCDEIQCTRPYMLRQQKVGLEHQRIHTAATIATISTCLSVVRDDDGGTHSLYNPQPWAGDILRRTVIFRRQDSLHT